MLKVSRKIKLWAGLTLIASLLGFTVSFAVAAANRPTPDDIPAGVEPIVTGPKAVVASGKTPSGSSYSITAYQSNKGLCVDLESSTMPGLVSGSCGFGLEGEKGVAGDRAVSTISETLGSADTFVYGPTVPGAERVTIVMESGRTFSVPTRASSRVFGNSRFDFYVTTVPARMPVPKGVASRRDSATHGESAPEHNAGTLHSGSRSPVMVVEAKDASGNILGRFTP